MIPVQMDFPCWANSDYLEDIPVTENGMPVDLTGMTVRMEVRRYPGGPLVFTPTTTIDENVIGIVIERQKLTNALSVAQLFSYDLLIIHPDKIQEIYAQGNVYIQTGVSRNG